MDTENKLAVVKSGQEWTRGGDTKWRSGSQSANFSVLK